MLGENEIGVIDFADGDLLAVESRRHQHPLRRLREKISRWQRGQQQKRDPENIAD
jgi:hypothetical protein